MKRDNKFHRGQATLRHLRGRRQFAGCHVMSFRRRVMIRGELKWMATYHAAKEQPGPKTLRIRGSRDDTEQEFVNQAGTGGGGMWSVRMIRAVVVNFRKAIESLHHRVENA